MHLAATLKAIASGLPLPGRIPPYLVSISVEATVVVNVGGATAQLNPAGVSNRGDAYPTTGFTYASANAGIASVDASGVVTGVAGGSVNITVTHTLSGLTAVCAVTSVPAVTPSYVDAITISPNTDAVLLVGSAFTLEATPSSGGVEFPTTLTWEVTTSGKVSIDPNVGPTYKHANITGVAVGTTQVKARAVGAGVGGIDIVSAPVNVAVQTLAPVGTPNLPVGPTWVTLLDWVPRAVPYPANTVVDGLRSYANSTYTTTVIKSDASAPNGKVMRTWYRPDRNGGGGYEQLSASWANGSYRSLYRRTHKKYSVGFNMQGNVGAKDEFIYHTAYKVGTTNYTHGYFSGFQGGDPDTGKSSLNTDAFNPSQVLGNYNWRSLVGIHMQEFLAVMQSAKGVHDGKSNFYLDGAVDKLYSTRQYIHDSAPIAEIFWFNNTSGIQLSCTYGGGTGHPPGVLVVGANGSCRRTDGRKGTSIAGSFTLDPAEPNFDITNTTNSDEGKAWSFMSSGGVPTYLRITNISADGRTMIHPSIPAGSVCVYETKDEAFQASSIGKTITFRRPVLDYNYTFVGGNQVGGTGDFPLILQAVVTGVTTTTLKNDTLVFTGDARHPLDAYCFMFGLDQFALTEPIYHDRASELIMASSTRA